MTTINNTFSIYIHRAHINCIDPDIFRNTFNRVLGSDCVRSVDIVKKTDDNKVPFIRAFIHFKFWPQNKTADKMCYELMSGKRLEVTYNHETKWFWSFCRSKLPARDVRVKPHNNNNNNNKLIMEEDTSADDDLPRPPVLQRAVSNIYYKETSNRNVSNKPNWMVDL